VNGLRLRDLADAEDLGARLVFVDVEGDPLG